MEPVCTEPNQNADFGAMPERLVEIFVLCFSETDVSWYMQNNFQTEKMHMNSIRKALIIQVQQIFIVTLCGFHIKT